MHHSWREWSLYHVCFVAKNGIFYAAVSTPYPTDGTIASSWVQFSSQYFCSSSPPPPSTTPYSPRWDSSYWAYKPAWPWRDKPWRQHRGSVLSRAACTRSHRLPVWNLPGLTRTVRSETCTGWVRPSTCCRIVWTRIWWPNRTAMFGERTFQSRWTRQKYPKNTTPCLQCLPRCCAVIWSSHNFSHIYVVLDRS